MKVNCNNFTKALCEKWDKYQSERMKEYPDLIKDGDYYFYLRDPYLFIKDFGEPDKKWHVGDYRIVNLTDDNSWSRWYAIYFEKDELSEEATLIVTEITWNTKTRMFEEKRLEENIPSFIEDDLVWRFDNVVFKKGVKK